MTLSVRCFVATAAKTPLVLLTIQTTKISENETCLGNLVDTESQIGASFTSYFDICEDCAPLIFNCGPCLSAVFCSTFFTTAWYHNIYLPFLQYLHCRFYTSCLKSLDVKYFGLPDLARCLFSRKVHVRTAQNSMLYELKRVLYSKSFLCECHVQADSSIASSTAWRSSRATPLCQRSMALTRN